MKRWHLFKKHSLDINIVMSAFKRKNNDIVEVGPGIKLRKWPHWKTKKAYDFRDFINDNKQRKNLVCCVSIYIYK